METVSLGVARENGAPNSTQRQIQETHHEMRIPERDINTWPLICLLIYAYKRKKVNR